MTEQLSPYYLLAATIPPGNRLKRFFQDDADSPAGHLMKAEHFRDAGFGVPTGRAVRLEDDHWEARGGDRLLLRVFQDGTVLFRMRADGEFLGWGSQNFAIPQWLNPVAVVESHTSFVHLYASLAMHFLRRPLEVRFQLIFRHGLVDGKRLALSPYYPKGLQNVIEPKLYDLHESNACTDCTVEAETVMGRPNRASFVILERFYELFDAAAKEIPFTTEVGRDWEIDVDAIRRL